MGENYWSDRLRTKWREIMDGTVYADDPSFEDELDDYIVRLRHDLNTEIM